MNRFIKGLLLFVGGVGIGSFVTKAWMEKKYENLVQQEVDAVMEHFQKKREPKETCVEEEVEETEDLTPQNTLKTAPKAYRDPVSYDRYKNMARKYKDDGEDLEEDTDEAQDCYKYETAGADKDKPPYVISIDEFSEEMDHFDKTTIYFYEDDEVLTEENEEVIENVEQVVGKNNLEHFGDRSRDPEVVYIRNEKLRTDYEVIRLSKSYAETVLGGGGMR